MLRIANEVDTALALRLAVHFHGKRNSIVSPKRRAGLSTNDVKLSFFSPRFRSPFLWFKTLHICFLFSLSPSTHSLYATDSEVHLLLYFFFSLSFTYDHELNIDSRHTLGSIRTLLFSFSLTLTLLCNEINNRCYLFVDTSTPRKEADVFRIDVLFREDNSFISKLCLSDYLTMSR